MLLKKHKRTGYIISAIIIFAGLLVLILLFLAKQLVYGKTTVIDDSELYGQEIDSGVWSPLVVFPDKETESLSRDYYYKFQDEIFSPVCQIYLKSVYTEEQFQIEKERLESESLSYLGQTNQLHKDTDNYIVPAYVALANWGDRYEYALMIDNLNTIVYVYMQNVESDNLKMDRVWLPVYFQENNAEVYANESMNDDELSFYGFLIGNNYVECMDLVE